MRTVGASQFGHRSPLGSIRQNRIVAATMRTTNRPPKTSVKIAASDIAPPGLPAAPAYVVRKSLASISERPDRGARRDRRRFAGRLSESLLDRHPRLNV